MLGARTYRRIEKGSEGIGKGTGERSRRRHHKEEDEEEENKIETIFLFAKLL